MVIGLHPIRAMHIKCNAYVIKYPFQANNILSLAMKITSEEVAPIPSKYSK